VRLQHGQHPRVVEQSQRLTAVQRQVVSGQMLAAAA
jgi:hypothetical protein